MRMILQPIFRSYGFSSIFLLWRGLVCGSLCPKGGYGGLSFL